MMIAILGFMLGLMLVVDRVVWRSVGDALPWYASPFAWFVLPWIGSLGLLALPIVVHQETLRIEHVLFISACFLAFMLGGFLFHFVGRQFSGPGGVQHIANQVSDKLYYGVAILGYIGQIAAILDSIQTSGISLLDRFSAQGLSGARAAMFEAQAMGAGGRFAILEPYAAFSFVFCACYLVDLSSGADRAKKLVSKFFVVSSALLIIFNSLVVSGGRANLLLLSMATMAVVCLDRRKYVYLQFSKLSVLTRWSIGVLALLVSVSALILLSTVFVEARLGGTSPDFLLMQSHRAKLNPVIDSLTRDLPGVRHGLFTLSYFTVPIPTLTYFLDLPGSFFPGPYWGQYNFPGFSDNVLRRILPDEFYLGWGRVRYEVFGMLSMNGYGGNVWSSLLRDLSVDFTRTGAAIFLFFFGGLSRLVVSAAYKRMDPLLIAMAAAILVILGYSILHSLFYIQSIWGLFFYSSAAYLFGLLLRRF
jgi:hypothetical protein